MTKQDLEAVDLLAAELAEFTCSRTSDGFYRKAIRLLGIGLVREAMGHVHQRDITRDHGLEPLKDKAKYLTDTLVRWMKERGLYENTYPQEPPESGRVLAQNAFSLVEPTSKSSIVVEKDEIKSLDFPFSPGLVQWLVFVGPEYFTLNNEMRNADEGPKFDLVESTSVAFRGKQYSVPMIRGKFTRNDKGRGILTAKHMQIKGAIERIWADSRGLHSVQGRHCVVNASVPQIAKYMGIKTSGTEYKRIAEKVHDLKGTGYCYLLEDNPELKAMGLEDMSFTFFGDVTSVTVDGITYFQIEFSKIYSACLLARENSIESSHIVSRPLDMLEIGSGISLKLYLYLYPILTTQKEHSIELKNLIKALDLRLAGWHHYKSQRKREFEKAINDINGRKDHKGNVFELSIEQGLNKADFMLVSRLKDKC